jgi:DNA-binding NarL/FixJ family response regulator
MKKAKSKCTGAPFTPREEQVLQLLADIRTNEEMCAELSIEEGTLVNHFKNIQRKTNLYGSRKILLIKYAQEHGYGRQVPA